MTRQRATTTGFGTMQLLALATLGSAPVPPLHLSAIRFATAPLLSTLITMLAGAPLRAVF